VGECSAGKELVTIDKMQQRHRLAVQRMDDMPVVDDMTVLAIGARTPPPQRHKMC
jgi:hypothetical protein